MDIYTNFNGQYYKIASSTTHVNNTNKVYVKEWLRDNIPLTSDSRLAYRTSVPKLKVWLNGKEWEPAKEAWFPNHVTFNYWGETIKGNRAGKWIKGEVDWWRNQWATGVFDGIKGHLYATVSKNGTLADGTSNSNINDNTLQVNITMNMGGSYSSYNINKNVTQTQTEIFVGGSWPTPHSQDTRYININNVSIKLNENNINAVWENGLGVGRPIAFAKSHES